MPFIRFRPAPELDKEQIMAALVEELLHPHDEPDRPLISIDRSRLRYHVAVIWNRWGSLTQVERSELIMEAYEQAFGEEALRVSSAMGLTPAEAERMGLAFDLAPV